MNSAPTSQPDPLLKKRYNILAGIALILFGIVIMADQYFKTGWLSLLIVPAAGFLFLVVAYFTHKLGFIITGSLLLGLGLSGFFAFPSLIHLEFRKRVIFILLVFSVAWAIIPLFSSWVISRKNLWAWIPAASLAILAGLLYMITWQPLDLLLYFPAVIGIVFLLFGVIYRKFGLIIPGCLLVTIAPGVYFAWTQPGEPNSLARTGIMLVTFALGWGLITVFSRVLTEQFVWWPLIPGGVLAMVGWGLYTAGNPGQAWTFIGNTGSIGLIIFGIYLLLWRNGIRR